MDARIMISIFRPVILGLAILLVCGNHAESDWQTGIVHQGLLGLSKNVNQAIVVEVLEAGSYRAVISGWQRREGRWERVIGARDAVIGRAGLAPIGEKKEGDGRTPQGIFALQRAFGYDTNVATGLEYERVDEKDFWIDDPASSRYNRHVRGEVPDVSHERLRRPDNLYKLAAVIEYNTDPVIPGDGSAIFMHIWRSAKHSTAGCVAMAQGHILRFLNWLDRRESPVIILKMKEGQSAVGENLSDGLGGAASISLTEGR